MALRFSLDTSCVLNLLNPDEPLDDALIELLRLAMLNEVELRVTEVYQGEVAEVQGRRAEVAKRARFLPVVEIPRDRLTERDALSDAFFNTLWPNSPGDTNKADHGRRDCLHLAAHVLTGGAGFVTRDGKLRDKVAARLNHPALHVYAPLDALALVESKRPQAYSFVTHSLAVRLASSNDRADLAALLAPLRDDYDDFEGWLAKTLSDPKTVVNVGVVDGTKPQGVAIWKPKDARTAKLSTFYLHPDARRGGLGQHMLFHCIRQWIEKLIERAYVTAGAEKEDIIDFLLGFGFRIEGAAQRRYTKGGTEFVLAKHLSYSVLTEDTLPTWRNGFASSVFSITPPSTPSAAENWFVRPRSVRRTIDWDAASLRVRVCGDEQDDIVSFTVADLETLFYPVRFALPGRLAYVVPIQPQWAERMMDTKPAQAKMFSFVDKLMLRIDNAYYCSPVYADDDVLGSPILFYVSAPESSLTGVARIIDRVIAEPEDLYLRFAQLGIYKLENIKSHVAKTGRHAGCAMAMHFGWWVPFPKPIPLTSARGNGLLNGHPQRMLRIDYDKFEAAMRQGGLPW